MKVSTTLVPVVVINREAWADFPRDAICGTKRTPTETNECNNIVIKKEDIKKEIKDETPTAVLGSWMSGTSTEYNSTIIKKEDIKKIFFTSSFDNKPDPLLNPVQPDYVEKKEEIPEIKHLIKATDDDLKVFSKSTADFSRIPIVKILRNSVIESAVKKYEDEKKVLDIGRGCLILETGKTVENVASPWIKTRQESAGNSSICKDTISNRQTCLGDRIQRQPAQHAMFYVCQTCNESFADKQCLDIHLETHLPVAPLITWSTNPEELLLKRRSSRNKVTKNSSVTSSLNMDSSTDSTADMFECDVCNRVLSSKRSLERHHKIVHKRLKPFKCDICGKCFSTKSNLSIHQKLHSGVKLFKCDICGYQGFHKHSLAAHQQVHSKVKPFKCDVCDKHFPSKSRLSLHQKLHLGIKPFKCDTCGKCFISKAKLTRHQLVHSGAKPFKCDICGKQVALRDNLYKHKATHYGVKPFKCDTCGKRFSVKTSLDVHQVVHTGAKPYKCDICGKSFSFKRNVVVHQVVHSEVKPFKCNTCGRCFSQKPALSIHQTVHSDAKPFECGVCGKSFSTKRSITMHQVVHYDAKPYKCDICDKSFSFTSNLARHKATVHLQVKPLKRNVKC